MDERGGTTSQLSLACLDVEQEWGLNRDTLTTIATATAIAAAFCLMVMEIGLEYGS